MNHLSPDINVGVSQQQQNNPSAKAWRKNRDFSPRPKNNVAKAGICLKIVFTSLKAGADFKKCRQN